jgi:hypothetical protein
MGVWSKSFGFAVSFGGWIMFLATVLVGLGVQALVTAVI